MAPDGPTTIIVHQSPECCNHGPFKMNMISISLFIYSTPGLSSRLEDEAGFE
jgi:hypothetical protein